MEEWEVFSERKQAPVAEPNILIQSRGPMEVSEKAGEVWFAAAPASKKRQDIHVELLRQKNRRDVIGIRVAQPSTTTYPLRRPKRGKAFLISCKKFLQACEIELKPQRFSAHMVGNILVV